MVSRCGDLFPRCLFRTIRSSSLTLTIFEGRRTVVSGQEKSFWLRHQKSLIFRRLGAQFDTVMSSGQLWLARASASVQSDRAFYRLQILAAKLAIVRAFRLAISFLFWASAALTLCVVATSGLVLAETPPMELSSPAFPAGGSIPARFTCTGADGSPPLKWEDAPAGTESFALIVEDPDAPSGTFVHWVIFNLPKGDSGTPADLPKTPSLPDGGMQGTNSFGVVGYRGPCPPAGTPHHYHFILFALDSKLDADSSEDAGSLRSAMSGHIKATTELVGTFTR